LTGQVGSEFLCRVIRKTRRGTPGERAIVDCSRRDNTPVSSLQRPEIEQVIPSRQVNQLPDPHSARCFDRLRTCRRSLAAADLLVLARTDGAGVLNRLLGAVGGRLQTACGFSPRVYVTPRLNVMLGSLRRLLDPLRILIRPEPARADDVVLSSLLQEVRLHGLLRFHLLVSGRL
jgi:hypothetical protein